MLTLTNFNTYTGGTTVNGGTLALNAGGNQGAINGVLNINPGAVVELNHADAVGYTTAGDYVTTVNIVGGVIDNTTNSWNAFTTNFNLTGGTISAINGTSSSTNNNPAFNFNAGYGITTYGSTATSLISAGILICAGTLAFNVTSGTTSSGIDLQDTGVIAQFTAGLGITKSGLGLMELTASNTYTGLTTVSAGTLQLGDGVSNNGSVASTTIANSGVLTFANPYAQTYGGSITGTGGLIKTGPGTLTLTSNLGSFNGPTTVNAGNLAFVNQLFGNTIITINSPGALNVTGAYPSVTDWLTNTNNNDINFINTASTGAVALTGNDSESIYLPGTGYNTLSVGAMAGGATFSGVLTPAASTYYLGGGGGPLTYTPAITGNYGLVVGSVGSVILTGSNSYTGPTTIASGGTLQFSSAANRDP